MNFKFAIALDVNKCIKQIKFPISAHACTPISELPPHISTIALHQSKYVLHLSCFGHRTRKRMCELEKGPPTVSKYEILMIIFHHWAALNI